MAWNTKHQLGDLQLQIMRILWEVGAAPVAEVHERLGADRLAYTTIATMLRKMERRGLVGHRTDSRRFIYFAKVSEQEVAQGAAADLVDRLFGGRLADAVSHLLESREISEDELRRLEELIAQHKARG